MKERYMNEGQHGAGKGDTYRRVNLEEYGRNYDAIFGKKKKKKKRTDRMRRTDSAKTDRIRRTD
jgi:hypothetical protein